MVTISEVNVNLEKDCKEILIYLNLFYLVFKGNFSVLELVSNTIDMSHLLNILMVIESNYKNL